MPKSLDWVLVLNLKTKKALKHFRFETTEL